MRRNRAHTRKAGDRTRGRYRRRGAIEFVNVCERLTGQQPEDRVVEVVGVEALHIGRGPDGKAFDVFAPVFLAQAQAGKFCRAVQTTAVARKARRVEEVDPAAAGEVEADPSHVIAPNGLRTKSLAR